MYFEYLLVLGLGLGTYYPGLPGNLHSSCGCGGGGSLLYLT